MWDTPASDTNTYTAGAAYTKKMAKRAGGTALQNTVSVFYMVTGPGVLTINVGGRVTTHNITKVGEPDRVVVPLLPIGTGLISASFARDGDVTANIPTSEFHRVRTTLVAQAVDYHYRSSTKN